MTQASNVLCYSMQAPVLVFFVAIYVAYLSLAAFVLSVVIVGTAGTIFHFRSRRLTAERAEAAEQERRLFDRMADFLDGFKEVRLNSARSADLFDHAFDVSRAAANIKIHSPDRILPADRVGSELHVHPARHRRVRDSDIQCFDWRFIDYEGHDGAAVRYRRVFWFGAIDTGSDERECRGRPRGEIAKPLSRRAL